VWPASWHKLPQKSGGSYGECVSQAHNGSLGAKLPARSNGRVLGQGSGEKLQTFRLSEVQMRHKFVHFIILNTLFERISWPFCLELFYWSFHCDKKWGIGSEAWKPLSLKSVGGGSSLQQPNRSLRLCANVIYHEPERLLCQISGRKLYSNDFGKCAGYGHVSCTVQTTNRKWYGWRAVHAAFRARCADGLLQCWRVRSSDSTSFSAVAR